MAQGNEVMVFMKEAGLVLLCAIPAVVGVVALLWTLLETTVLDPLGKAILVVPVYDADTPVAEILRVARMGSCGHATVVADMRGCVEAPEKLVELGLCDAVTDASGVERFVRSRLRREPISPET